MPKRPSLCEATSHLDAAEACFDLIILDVNLPDDGCDFCVPIRQQGARMPITLGKIRFANVRDEGARYSPTRRCQLLPWTYM